MSSEKPKTAATAPDDVDRATDRIRQAADELVRLMGNPAGDSPIDTRAARALIDLGAYAVGPLTDGLRQARGLYHRYAIINLIGQLATEPTPEVVEVLGQVALKDRQESVRCLARDAISAIATREMMAMTQARRRRSAQAPSPAPPPESVPLPDGCSSSLARLIRAGEVRVAGDRS